MLLLRIEKQDERHGPYTGWMVNGKPKYSGGFRCAEKDKWPAPPAFMNIKNVFFGYKYCFKTVKLLTDWFSWTERKAMGKRGFILSIYDCPEDKTMFNDCQGVFEEKSAKLVKEIPLPSTAKEIEKILADLAAKA